MISEYQFKTKEAPPKLAASDRLLFLSLCSCIVSAIKSKSKQPNTMNVRVM